MEKELVDLGTRFGLVSSVTSYVAIEERPEGEKTDGAPELRRIPVALSQGWGGFGPVPYGGFGGAVAGCKFSAPAHVAPLSADLCAGLDAAAPLGRAGSARPGARGSTGPAEADSALDAVLFSQRADGAWELTAELAELVGAELADLVEAAERVESPEAQAILATLLVLGLLEDLAQEPEFRAMVRKARAWVRNATSGMTPPEGGDSWSQWALDVLREHARPAEASS